MTSDQILALITALRKEAEGLYASNNYLRDQIVFLANQVQQLMPGSVKLQSEICVIASLAVLHRPGRALDRLETIVWRTFRPFNVAPRQAFVRLLACNVRRD